MVDSGGACAASEGKTVAQDSALNKNKKGRILRTFGRGLYKGPKGLILEQ